MYYYQLVLKISRFLNFHANGMLGDMATLATHQHKDSVA